MRVIVFLSFLLFGAIGAPTAVACTFQINETAVRNRLAAQVYTNLDISVEQVSQTTIRDYRWWISRNTPMCPEETKAEAIISVTYADSDGLSGLCLSRVKVTETSSWLPAGRTSYEFTVLQAPLCTQGEGRAVGAFGVDGFCSHFLRPELLVRTGPELKCAVAADSCAVSDLVARGFEEDVAGHCRVASH